MDGQRMLGWAQEIGVDNKSTSVRGIAATYTFREVHRLGITAKVKRNAQ